LKKKLERFLRNVCKLSEINLNLQPLSEKLPDLMKSEYFGEQAKSDFQKKVTKNFLKNLISEKSVLSLHSLRK